MRLINSSSLYIDIQKTKSIESALIMRLMILIKAQQKTHINSVKLSLTVSFINTQSESILLFYQSRACALLYAHISMRRDMNASCEYTTLNKVSSNNARVQY